MQRNHDDWTDVRGSGSGSPSPAREIVLVTGGAGHLGRAVCARLANRYKVVAADLRDTLRDWEAPPGVKRLPLDVTSDDSVHTALDRLRERYGPRLASVIHLAAYHDFSGKPSERYQTITVEGTDRLLEALHAMEVEQFVFSSSMLVHAPTRPGRPLTEESPLRATWDYPKSKIKAENIIREHRGSIPVVLLRIAGVYDDRCRLRPLAQQIRRVFEGRLTSHFFPGDLGHGQSFMHLDDLLDAIVQVVALRHDLPFESTLLLGEPEVMSYGTLQQQIAGQLHDNSWWTLRVPGGLAKLALWMQHRLPGVEPPFIRPNMVDLADAHYELDISRARTLLGWEPLHRLETELPRLLRSLAADPTAWYEANGFTLPERVRARLAASAAEPPSLDRSLAELHETLSGNT